MKLYLSFACIDYIFAHDVPSLSSIFHLGEFCHVHWIICLFRI